MWYNGGLKYSEIKHKFTIFLKALNNSMKDHQCCYQHLRTDDTFRSHLIRTYIKSFSIVKKKC